MTESIEWLGVAGLLTSYVGWAVAIGLVLACIASVMSRGR